jgi:Co/Zn/Cd efflux system component
MNDHLATNHTIMGMIIRLAMATPTASSIPRSRPDRGLRAIKSSFVGLTATAVIQLVVVFISGSVALLADTIHNFGMLRPRS